MKKHFVLSILIFFTPMTFLTAQWEPEIRLSAKDSIYSWSGGRGIAAGPQTVHVVWSDARDAVGGEGQEIYYIRSTDDGVTWGPETRLTHNTPQISSAADIAVSSGSVVHLVWYRFIDWPNRDIYYMRSTDNGITWSAETRLTSTNAADVASVATAGPIVHMAFQSSHTGISQMYYMRSTDEGLTWSAMMPISNTDGFFPQIATSGSAVHVAWTDMRDGHTEIYYCRSTDSGVTWGSDMRLSTLDQTGSQFCSVAASGSYVHVAWQDLYHVGGVPAGVYYRRSTNGGSSWQSEIRLGADHFNTATSNYPQGATLCTSGSNVYLCWEDLRDDADMMFWNGEIYYKYSRNNGNTWSHDVRLTYCLSFRKSVPSNTASNEAIHVVWCDKRDYTMTYGGTYEIYYKRDATGNIVGVKEESETTRHMPNMLKTVPNPFVSFTTVPGHEGESFVLYDISGRQCGTYKGARIGEMLPVGVYFVRPLKKHFAPVRVVKIK